MDSKTWMPIHFVFGLILSTIIVRVGGRQNLTLASSKNDDEHDDSSISSEKIEILSVETTLIFQTGKTILC